MAEKIDLKRDLKAVYSAKRTPALLEIPEISFLMIDGAGDPNNSAEYGEAVGALYSLAYTLKFASKAEGRDFVVMPLQGLWWAEDMDAFARGDKDAWSWTMMIAVPPLEEGLVAEVRGIAADKKPSPALSRVRLEAFAEGRVAQVLHIGPYAEEAPTIDALHVFIEEQGLARRGKHHEIYLSDPSRTTPEKLRTIVRQPVG